ncbi:MAG: hypothetical protein ACK5AM_01165 [Pirellulaceae bacterium]|jgi:hypothetical protein
MMCVAPLCPWSGSALPIFATLWGIAQIEAECGIHRLNILAILSQRGGS